MSARSSKSHLFLNEIPEKEIECKIGLSAEADVTEVASRLVQAFDNPRNSLSLLMKKITRERKTLFKKYEDQRGTFSVRERSNGTFCLKRKTNKQNLGSGVSVNDVEKIDFGAQYPDQAVAGATFIVSFTRQKLNFHLQNEQSRRVFSIKVDQYETPERENIESLRRVEIEYKGLIGAPVAGTHDVLKQLADDTYQTRETIFTVLEELGYKLQRNPKALGKWLRGE